MPYDGLNFVLLRCWLQDARIRERGSLAELGGRSLVAPQMLEVEDRVTGVVVPKTQTVSILAYPLSYLKGADPSLHELRPFTLALGPLERVRVD